MIFENGRVHLTKEEKDRMVIEITQKEQRTTLTKISFISGIVGFLICAAAYEINDNFKSNKQDVAPTKTENTVSVETPVVNKANTFELK